MGDLLSLLQDFDIANFLPEPDKFLRSLAGWARLMVLVGPVVLLALGLWYLYGPPGEVRNTVGLRIFHVGDNPKAWRYAKKLAGAAYTALGGGLTVVMLVVSLFFNFLWGMGMITVALICVILELLLLVGVWIAINILVERNFGKRK